MSQHVYVLHRGDELISVSKDLGMAKGMSGAKSWENHWNVWTSPDGLTITREEWHIVRERLYRAGAVPTHDSETYVAQDRAEGRQGPLCVIP